MREISLDDIKLPQEFPYLIKTSHGLSCEGTYIIKNSGDLQYSLLELRKYLDINLLDTIIFSEFVKDEVENYCVQFYVNKAGEVSLIGVTGQLVTSMVNYTRSILIFVLMVQLLYVYNVIPY
ncbi:hypothetical protein [Floridanema evergladense]|uniref:LAGLIDADG homing endonuclease n=1 Tax=Floridaenema evergladense BLCC-F167 TaxID=3153639 RepID=A0ABV4WFG7_9CYAN